MVVAYAAHTVAQQFEHFIVAHGVPFKMRRQVVSKTKQDKL
jgi:hypothetical protein